MHQSRDDREKLAEVRLELLAGRIDTAGERLDRLTGEHYRVLPEWWNAHGIVARHRGEFAQALQAWQEACRLEPRAEFLHNLATVLRDLGRLEDSVSTCRLALEKFPQAAPLWCNLGTSLVELDQLPEAADAFKSAIRLDPDTADAHGALGVIATRLEDLQTARRALHRAIELDRRRAAFHDALGLLEMRCGDYQRAIACHAEATRLEPNNSEAWNNLGYALTKIGFADRAMGALQRALQLSPDFAEASNNLGNACRDCGQLEAAKEHYRRALLGRPGFPEAIFNLADVHRFQKSDSQLRELLETSIPDDHAAAALLHFARGKALDDIEDHAGAFAEWRRANALMRRITAYDESRTLGLIHRLIDSTRTAQLDAKAEDVPGEPANEPNKRSVFIVGTPRCGSTLLEQILASHPSVDALGEIDFMERALVEAIPNFDDELPYWPSWDSTRLARIAERYRQQVERWGRLRADTRWTIDKFLANSLYLGPIVRAMPNAKIIILSRDRRDSGLSCWSKRFASGHHYAYDLQELGRYLSAHHELMKGWIRCLPTRDVMSIDYETLAEHPRATVKSVLDFLELPWHPSCLEFHRTDRIVRTASAVQVREPIHTAGIGRWRAYADELLPMIKQWEGR